jgi:ComF family protein
MFRGLHHAILNSWLAQQCLLCDGRGGADPVCAACAAELPQLPPHCPRCAQPSPAGRVCGACVAHPPAYDATVALWAYRYPADRLVHALKYHGRLQLAGWFARALAPRLAPHDAWLPVPLHASRLAARGFNQAMEIARVLAPQGRLHAAAVRRLRATVSQSELPPGERARNVRRAFGCTLRLDGLAVAVVDDVMTTGATLNELAVTLKRAGAARVTNVVVARTLVDT